MHRQNGAAQSRPRPLPQPVLIARFEVRNDVVMSCMLAVRMSESTQHALDGYACGVHRERVPLKPS
jgi:hypothetical protein